MGAHFIKARYPLAMPWYWILINIIFNLKNLFWISLLFHWIFLGLPNLYRRSLPKISAIVNAKSKIKWLYFKFVLVCVDFVHRSLWSRCVFFTYLRYFLIYINTTLKVSKVSMNPIINENLNHVYFYARKTSPYTRQIKPKNNKATMNANEHLYQPYLHNFRL